MYPVSILIIVLILMGLIMMWKGDYPVVGVLVLTNIAVFSVQWIYSILIGDSGHYILDLGFKPKYLINGSRSWTIFTNLYIHADFLHIMGNMLFLVLMGMPFEERIGSRKFMVIYFTSGLLANVFDASVTLSLHGSGSAEAKIIGIGASGAIFGIMGGFAYLYPKDEIPMLLGPIFLPRVPVYIGVGAYALFELFAVQLSPDDHIGHVAHICGFVVGVMMAPIVANREVKREAKLDYNLLDELLGPREIQGIGDDHSDYRDPVVERAIMNIRSTDIKEVKDAWWDELLQKASCPKCNAKLIDSGHGLKCSTCSYDLDIRKRKKG